MTDPVFWHRVQFGFTITFHYLFPQLTMGLAWFLGFLTVGFGSIVAFDVLVSLATFAVSGPRSRDVLARLETDIDLSDAALRHMSIAHGTMEGKPARIARVSFTGERSYEISVPSRHGPAFWRRFFPQGRSP